MSGCGRLMGQDYVCGDGILCEQCQRIAALEAELAKARTDNFVLRQNSVDMAVWQDEHRKRMEAENGIAKVEADNAALRALVGEMLPHTRYVRKLQKVHYLDTTDIDNLIASAVAEGE